MDVGDRQMRRIAVTARVVVGVALIALCVLKAIGAPAAHVKVEGLATLLAAREVQVAAAVIEGTLGVAFLTPWFRKVTPWLVLWLSILSGVTLSFLAGLASAGCGCIGPLRVAAPARAAMLIGLWALTLVALRSENRVGSTSAPLHADR